MKTKLLAMVLLAGSTLFGQTNFSFGISINQAPRGYYAAPPPPPPYARVIPRSPGRGYIWVPGYYVSVGNRYNWRNGYWSAPVRFNGNGRNNNRGNGFGRNNRYR